MRRVLQAVIGIQLTCLSFTPALAKSGYEVKHRGSMRDMLHSGDLSPKVDLAPLARNKHLYAVGPIAGLKGEITAIDSTVWTATVPKTPASHPEVVANPETRAIFLVWAEVPAWDAVPVDAAITSLSDLQALVERVARERGIDMTRPFPFRLEGTPAKAGYHVVNKTDDAPHTPQDHERIKVKYELSGEAVEMIGFWSDRHQGVFTHHDSHIHVHLHAKDDKKSGHLDELTMTGAAVLHLPRTK